MLPGVVAIGVHRMAAFGDDLRSILLIRKSLGVVVSMGSSFSADLPQDEEFLSPISERPRSPHAPGVVAIGVDRVAALHDGPRPIVLLQHSLGAVVSMGACFSADLSQDEEFPSPISERPQSLCLTAW